MGLHSPRSVLRFGDQPNIDVLQFDPIAKAVFGFASVAFEVRARDYKRSRSRDNT